MRQIQEALIIFGSCVGSLCLLAGCHRPNLADAVRLAFSDFDYVGEFKANNFAPPDHEVRSARLPDSLKTDILYVFHNRKKIDEQALAMKILPSRLQAAGFTILEAPSKLEDFTFVDPGGAMWKITFRIGSQRGTVYNVIDKRRYYGRDTTAATDTADYVLRLDR